MGKVGRPSKLNDKLAQAIFLRMAQGESLLQICRDPDMPSKSTVLKWASENKEFSDQYAQARADLLDYWAEEIVDISEDGSNDWYDRETRNGNTIRVVDHEHVTRSKLRVDTRKWLLSKLAAKKYGERVFSEVSGPDGGPIETKSLDFENMTAAEKAMLSSLVLKSQAPGVETNGGGPHADN